MLLAIGICMVGLAPEILPGDRLSLEEAKNDASLIVAAEVKTTGYTIGLGAVAYMGDIKLEDATILKGKLEGDELDRLNLTVSGSEQSPRSGDKAIFFIEKLKGTQRFDIIKMLPLTDENLKEVKAPVKKPTASAVADPITPPIASIAASTRPFLDGARRTCGQSFQPL